MEKRQLNSEFKSTNTEQFPVDLFEKRDIVILGETSHGKHIETVLIFLEKFGSQIDQIFIELPVDYQNSVDRYFASGEIDIKLKSFFIGAEKEGKNIRGLLRIFDKLKAINKKIICFDSSKTQEGEYQKASERKNERYFLRGESRDEDMFTNFYQHYEQAPGKYLLITGANHAKESRYPEGHKRLGEKLKEVFGEKCISFRMKPD